MMVGKPIQSDDNFSSKSASEAENIVPGHRRWNQKSTVVAIALHSPGEDSKNMTYIGIYCQTIYMSEISKRTPWTIAHGRVTVDFAEYAICRLLHLQTTV